MQHDPRGTALPNAERATRGPGVSGADPSLAVRDDTWFGSQRNKNRTCFADLRAALENKRREPS